MTIKRSRVDDREVEAMAMANCSELLSRVGRNVNLDGRVFECKTCNKTFPSSQALGGHRARHKRPLLSSNVNRHLYIPTSSVLPEKPSSSKTSYECSICGLDFAARQALGRHMRRHRGGDTKEEKKSCVEIEMINSTVPLLKRSNSSKRVMCLDLNLTPYENDLKLEYFQMQRAVM